MDTSASKITTMGILAGEAYADEGQTYFQDKYDEITHQKIDQYINANGEQYKIIDHTDNYTWTTLGFEALLLEKTDAQGNSTYVVAFRGTEPASWLDWFNDIEVGISDFSTQYLAALKFVNNALARDDISKDNLVLTGHSLGGMLVQQVGATLGMDGYAFNPYGMDRMMQALFSDKSLVDVALYKMMQSVGLTSTEAAWAKDHILNVSYNDFGLLNGDILSNALTKYTSGFVGSYLPIYGADGNDTFNVLTDNNFIDGGSGNDTISTRNYATITTGSGADKVTAGDHATVTNLSGDDNIKTGDYANITGSMWDETISVGSDFLHVKKINLTRGVA